MFVIVEVCYKLSCFLKKKFKIYQIARWRMESCKDKIFWGFRIYGEELGSCGDAIFIQRQ
jgi:hypothetical protein